jgi:acyl-coenzyme A synthetase/AMP-(fatty) acid ligase
VVVLSGGAVLSPAVRSELLHHLPWAVVVDGYGTSETGGQGQMPVFSGQSTELVTRFHVDEDTAVLDDAGRPAPPGSGLVGRLARKGRIPLGYLGDPAATGETFVELHGQRWAIPGDLAKVEADGSITLLGRGSPVDQLRWREGLPRGGGKGPQGTSRRIRRRRGRHPSPPLR